MNKDKKQALRAWAPHNGFPNVSETGPIPKEVKKAYKSHWKAIHKGIKKTPKAVKRAIEIDVLVDEVLEMSDGRDDAEWVWLSRAHGNLTYFLQRHPRPGH